MTRPQFLADYRKACKALEAARNAVYACAPSRHVPLSNCLAIAPDNVRQAYLDARDRLDTLESQSVRAGLTYRATHSLLCWVGGGLVSLDRA